jgi:hypothetical protein
MSNILVGVFSAGVFTIAYTSAKEACVNTRAEMKNKENIETTVMKRQYSYETLAISWVNGLSLFGAFWVPIIFSFVVHHIGYTVAWLLGGLFSFLFILPSLRIVAIRGLILLYDQIWVQINQPFRVKTASDYFYFKRDCHINGIILDFDL